MRLYFDQTVTPELNINECGDCRADSQNRLFLSPPLSSDEEHRLFSAPLRHTAPLYAHECAPGYWLVCNPAGSGRLVVLDREAYTLFEQFRFPMKPADCSCAAPGLDPALLANIVIFFYRLGLLREVAAPPAALLDDTSETLMAWLHVTNACNLRCSYCYISKTNESMASDTAYQAVDAIFRSAQIHGFSSVYLRYAGGEPSLHMARVTALHDYAQQLARETGIALRASLLSNGVVLSQKAIDQLKARGIGLMISLDGIGAYHDRQRPFRSGLGSFKYVDRTIKRLLASGLVPSVSVTVSRHNLDGLCDLVDYLLDQDLPFSLNYYRENECSAHVHDLQFGEQQMIAAMRAAFALIERRLPRRRLLGSLLDKADLQAPHTHTCGVGRNYLVIDQRGGIAKCQAQIRQTVTTIAVADPLQAIRDDRSGVQGLSVDEKEGCRECEWRYWCAGGCPLLTYRATGRYDVKSPNCNIYKALFPDVLRLEALRLLRYETPLVPEELGRVVDENVPAAAYG